MTELMYKLTVSLRCVDIILMPGTKVRRELNQKVCNFHAAPQINFVKKLSTC